MEAHSSEVFVIGLTVFFLACIIGYYVVWSVTPALHSPLMGVTNAISSVIIVGAILAAGPFGHDTSKIFGIIGVVLASINIFGGFIVTYRMLSMFKKKPKKETSVVIDTVVAKSIFRSNASDLYSTIVFMHCGVFKWYSANCTVYIAPIEV